LNFDAGGGGGCPSQLLADNAGAPPARRSPKIAETRKGRGLSGVQWKPIDD